MILIKFHRTGLNLQRRHEFGHEAMPRLLEINLLFATVFIFGNGGTFFKFMRDYFTWEDHTQAPQYRMQVKRATSKARAQYEREYQRKAAKLEPEMNRLVEENKRLQKDRSLLINLGYQVRNLKDIDFDKLNDL